MMITTNQLSIIISSIFRSIDEFNQHLPEERQLNKDVNTVLFGEASQLESLELVSLILIVEENLEEEFDTIITLTNERAMSQKRSPFATVARLASYIDSLLKEPDHE